MLLTLLQPSSPQADALARISLMILILALVIFLLVAGLIAFASWRYREGRVTEQPAKNFGNRKIEILWTIAPFLVLMVVFFYTVKTMHQVDPPPGDTNADIVITGHQWWWEIKYVKTGVLTANEIHIPVGRPILIRLESADVIHDFWVPQLARKIDAIPGKSNYLYLEADRTGTFLGVCAEFCGTQHAGMRIRVIVQEEKDFEKWQQFQALTPSPVTGELAQAGAKLFKEKTCYNCHTIAGTGATLSIGPDLTYVATRETLGAGVLKNSAENLFEWLKDPQRFKPGSHMPNFQLSEQEAKALTAYLGGLK